VERRNNNRPNALRAFLLMPGASVPLGAFFFAVGSLIFSWLLLRGRMVPISIARLGLPGFTRWCGASYHSLSLRRLMRSA
jgi:hypothetical protein